MTGIIGTISPGEATALQSSFLRLLEQLIETTENQLKEKRAVGLSIFKQEKLIYGNQDHQFKNEITGLEGQLLHPNLLQQLEQLKNTPSGGIVEGASHLRVELEGRVILQSDADGKVMINELYEASAISSKNSPNPMKDQVEELAKGFAGLTDPPLSTPPLNFKSRTPEQMSRLTQELAEARNGSASPISLTKADEQSKAEKSSNFSSQKPESSPSIERGFERVQRSLEEFPDSPTKRLISTYTQDLQTLLKLAESQQNQIHDLQHSLRSLSHEIQQQRLAKSHRPSRWQQAKLAFNSTWKQWKHWRQQHQAAVSLYRFYTQSPVKEYQEIQFNQYRLHKEGKCFTLSNSSGQVIMQFQMNSLGISIQSSTVNINSQTAKDLKQFAQQQRRGEEPTGAFSRLGTQEAVAEIESYIRAKKIAFQLLKYAHSQGQDVTLDGQFSYQWVAQLNGEVQIRAKDGRDLILSQSGHQIFCQMSEKDFNYFEKALEQLRSHPASLATKSQHSKNQNHLEL